MSEGTIHDDIPEIVKVRPDVEGTSFDQLALAETGVADPEADTVDDMKAVSPPATKPPETTEEDGDGEDIGGEGGIHGE